jgi:hypothetical protein
MTRVFEDLDTPGVGQPFRVVVHLDLVDALTGEQVREAYYNGTTIIGVRKAPVDGTPAQWTQNTNGMARTSLPTPRSSTRARRAAPSGAGS